VFEKSSNLPPRSMWHVYLGWDNQADPDWSYRCTVKKFSYLPHPTVPKTIRSEIPDGNYGNIKPLETLFFKGIRIHQKVGILHH
jgi:hypothetical protein